MKAFPNQCNELIDGIVCGQNGMDLRDYFAAKAMQGMITSANSSCLSGLDGLEPYTAKYAYKMADAMMEARSK
jgi:hypothetical protein